MVRSTSVPVTHFLRPISFLHSFSRLTLLTYSSVLVNVCLPILQVSSDSQKLRLMDVNEIKNFLKGLPLWLRLVVLVALAVAVGFGLSSCANTKAVVRSSADNTTSSITITTNNPTSVNVTNKQDTIGLNFNPKKR
nr:MAG TPA: hypothetical protein [Microviridae sp.]